MSKKKDTMGAGSVRPSIATAHPKPEPIEETEKKKKRIVIRSPFRWSNRPEWLTTLLAIIGVLLMAYMLYYGAKVIDESLKKNQEHQTIATVWRQLLAADVNIIGTPTDLDELGNPRFPSLSFENTRSKLGLHRNLRLAAVLPGIRNISLAPADTQEIGTGFADDSTLEILGMYFTNLDVLDLSSTKVTTLQPIDDISIRRLKIFNAPIRREKLATLQLCKSVTDLWIGWHNDARRDNAIFFSDAYREKVLEVLSKMPNLKNLYIREMKFDREEQELLPGINIVELN